MIQDILTQNDNTNANDRQLAILKEHFPACFKADGGFDVERFKAEISDKTDVISEGYELKFLGKSYAKLMASTDTTTVIKPNTEHNNLPENANSQNIYISGDNLDGLKHLLKSYSKSIKCIYIDPPYNTGSDGFVYQDNFNYTLDNLQEKLSISEDEAQRILNLTRRGSSSHSAWLMFMYCRLLLARDLLTEDGVIFISIDDNEQANLKLLCDDVFGEENFLGQLIHNKLNSKNDTIDIQKNHDYVNCYKKKMNFEAGGKVRPTLLFSKHIRKDLIFEQGEYFYLNDPITTRGDGGTLNSRPNLGYTIYFDPRTQDFLGVQDYDIELARTLNEESEIYFDDKELLQKGYIPIRPPRVRGMLGAWTWDLANFNNSKKEIYIKVKRNGYSVHKRTFVDKSNVQSRGGKLFVEFLEEKNSRSIIDYSSNDGAIQLSEIFNKEAVFSNPKSIDLLSYLLSLVQSNSYTVLDFFSGSASTAHAVMQLNADDGGSRKFISVQLPEEISLDNASQKAAWDFLEENRLPKTLDYIGLERIRRAAVKIKEAELAKRIAAQADLFEEEETIELDLGFKHFALVEPNKNTLDKLDSFNKYSLLADTTILEDFGKPTILTTWLNADGYGLSTEAETVDLAGYTAYHCQKHLYLIDPNFTLDSMKALLSKYDSEGNFNPENLVLFGYSFPDWSISEMVEKNLRILNDGEKNLKINFYVRY